MRTDYYDYNAKNLGILRAKYGLTQQLVADSCSITREMLVRYENGTRNPPLRSLVALADFYGCSIDYIVGRTPNEPMNADYPADYVAPCVKLREQLESQTPRENRRIVMTPAQLEDMINATVARILNERQQPNEEKEN